MCQVVERVAASEIPLPSSEPCGTCKKTKRGITWDNEVILQLVLVLY